jgi:hypothetical protein
MSLISDNAGVIFTAITGAISGVFLFFKGKKSRESNANIEIGKAYELMAKQNNAFILSMTEKIDKQTKKIEDLEFEVIGLRNENKLLLGQLKKYRK